MQASHTEHYHRLQAIAADLDTGAYKIGAWQRWQRDTKNDPAFDPGSSSEPNVSALIDATDSGKFRST